MRRGGFSLVEISIVLIVVSVMISGVLPYITESQKTNAANDTAERLEKIELAMLTYRAANGTIPCPSDITAGLNAAAFGTAVASGCATATFTDTNNAAGGVPTKTLGLSDEYGFDGWGRRMTYHVTRALTGSGYSSGTGALTVNDSAGNPRTAEAAYAVVSHGPNGHGAYTRAGTRFSFGSTNTNEQENCECNASATATTYDSILVQSMAMPNSNPLAAFDDIVRYQLKPSLELLVGGGGGTGGSCQGIAPSGWPDAIKCVNGANNWTLYQVLANATEVRYSRPCPGCSGGYSVSFNPTTKAYASHVDMTGYDCLSQSIPQLEAAGKTFNFCGGSGGGWADVPLTDTANFDVACSYRFTTAAGWVTTPAITTATEIRYTGLNAGGGNYEYRVLSSNKAQYNWRPEGSATFGSSAAITKMEKNCGGGGGGGGGGGTITVTQYLDSCANCGTKNLNMGPHDYCALSRHTESNDANNECRVYQSGSDWILRSINNVAQTLACGAQCFDGGGGGGGGGGDFGAFSAFTWGVTHTATSAGIVTAYANNTDTVSHCYVDGYVNGTLIARSGNREGYTNTRGFISFPVPNGATYRVTDGASTCTTEAAYFTPLN